MFPRWKKQLVAAAVTVALVTVVSLSSPKRLLAQVRAALVQDVDQPARAPFQAVVPININNFNFTAVPIPSGKRLVIDYVSMSGAAQTAGTDVQPIIILSSSVAGNPNALYYMAPTQSGTVPGQYYQSWPVTIFADSLSVSPAFAGFTPTFMAFNVVISGHLISVP
jgi:hypothetical protein